MEALLGQSLNDVFSYRYASPDLFTITGDLSLQPVLDPCITGEPQQAVVDGFFMMFKPLDPGEHTIVVHGTNRDKTFACYHRRVRRRAERGLQADLAAQGRGLEIGGSSGSLTASPRKVRENRSVPFSPVTLACGESDSLSICGHCRG